MMRRVFLALVGGLVVYELIAIAEHDEADTISAIIWTATARRPIVPFAIGVLMGHLFWQRARSDAGTLPPAAL